MAITEIEALTNHPEYGRAFKIEIFSFSNTKIILDESGFEETKVTFPAFLKDFSDSYKSDWNPQRVLGKMDPIATFKNTSRSIAISFDVPNTSIQEAKRNLAQIDYIIRGLYPVYDNGMFGTAVLASPPMYRVRFANFIRNAAINDDGTANTLRTGLLCYLNNFDFKPETSSGYFIEGENLYPKLISVNLTLNIIHEHPLGKATDEKGTIINRISFSNFPRLDNTLQRRREIEAEQQELKKEEKRLIDEKNELNSSLKTNNDVLKELQNFTPPVDPQLITDQKKAISQIEKDLSEVKQKLEKNQNDLITKSRDFKKEIDILNSRTKI